MKKLVVLMMVLGMASMAVAAPVLRVDPADQKDNYSPSDVITIQLYETGNAISFLCDAITDNSGGNALGTITESPTYNGSWGSTNAPDLINSDGKLIEYVGASVTQTGAYVTGVLYSFEYHVPTVPNSTVLTIQTFQNGNEFTPAEIDYYQDGKYLAPPELAVTIHVSSVPEPATIALLGLGGLLLKRRK